MAVGGKANEQVPCVKRSGCTAHDPPRTNRALQPDGCIQGGAQGSNCDHAPSLALHGDGCGAFARRKTSRRCLESSDGAEADLRESDGMMPAHSTLETDRRGFGCRTASQMCLETANGAKTGVRELNGAVSAHGTLKMDRGVTATSDAQVDPVCPERRERGVQVILVAAGPFRTRAGATWNGRWQATEGRCQDGTVAMGKVEALGAVPKVEALVAVPKVSEHTAQVRAILPWGTHAQCALKTDGGGAASHDTPPPVRRYLAYEAFLRVKW